MKKSSLLMCSLAALLIGFTSCEKKQNQNQGTDTPTDPTQVEVGFYVVGPATAVESFEASNLQDGMMAAGINENGKKPRAGLYEKYIALEADKEFELVYVDDKTIHYGADLKLETPYDVENGVTIQVNKGELKENLKMTVAKTGFYHIALDQNKVGDLEYPCIVVSPVDLLEDGADGVAWQMSNGSKNMTCTSGFNKKTMTWELKNAPIQAGQNFKFRWGNGWKVALDPMAEVRLESNIGKGNKSGGEDIELGQAGMYDFKLVWTLKGANIEQTLNGSFTRVGDLDIDYSNCEMELVGAAVADQDGAAADAVWTWGNTFPMGKPQINGDEVVWTVERVKMNAGEYKVRTVGAAASGGIDAFDNGSNQVIAAAGEYKIVFTLNMKTGDKVVTATALGEVSLPDYSAVKMELVGAAVAEQEGAVADATWSWGNTFPMGTPTKNGNVYTWTATAKMVSGEYKVRTVNYEAQGDIAAFDNGGNQAISEDGTYVITFVFDAENGSKEVTAVKQ